MTSKPIGLAFTPLENRREVILEAGVLADQLGYQFVGVPEGWGYDSTHLLAELGRRTSDIGLAATVLSIWGRSAGTTAMTAATLQALTGGRFELGLGASTSTLAEGFHDRTFANPAGALRTYTMKVRSLLNGDRLPEPAVKGARPLRLGIDAAPQTRIALAAMSSQSMAIAGELADRWLPFFVGHSALRDAISRVTAERPDDLSPLEVTPTVFAAAGDEARSIVAANFVLYMTVMGDIYPRLVRQQGFGSTLDQVLSANERPSDGVVPAEAERVLQEYAMYGSSDDVGEELAVWFDQGATSVALLMPPHAPWNVIEATLRAFAEAA